MRTRSIVQCLAVACIYFIVIALGVLGFTFGLKLTKGSDGTGTPYFVPGIIIGALYTPLFVMQCIHLFKLANDTPSRIMVSSPYALILYLALIFSLIGAAIVSSSGLCHDDTCYYTVNKRANKGIAIGLVALHVFSILFLIFTRVFIDDPDVKTDIQSKRVVPLERGKIVLNRITEPAGGMKDKHVELETKPDGLVKPPLKSRASTTSMFTVDAGTDDMTDNRTPGNSGLVDKQMMLFKRQGRQGSFDLSLYSRSRKPKLSHRNSGLPSITGGDNIDPFITDQNRTGRAGQASRMSEMKMQTKQTNVTSSDSGDIEARKGLHINAHTRTLGETVKRLDKELKKKQKKEKKAAKKHARNLEMSRSSNHGEDSDTGTRHDQSPYSNGNTRELTVDSRSPYWLPPPPPQGDPSFNPVPDDILYSGTAIPQTDLVAFKPLDAAK